MVSAKNILLSILVLAVAALNLINEDIAKFLLSGHSATYNMALIRHSPLVVFAISLVVILLIFLFKKNKVYRCLLGISLAVWILSLRTYTVVDSHDTILIFGFAVVPVHSFTLSPENIRSVKLDFIMAKEIGKAITPNR